MLRKQRGGKRQSLKRMMHEHLSDQSVKYKSVSSALEEEGTSRKLEVAACARTGIVCVVAS